MARFYGRDTYLLLSKRFYKFWGMYALGLVIVSVLVMWFVLFKIGFAFLPTIAIQLGILALAYVLFKIANIQKHQAVLFKKGITGENKVREQLQSLPDEYSVFVSVKLPLSKGNIDYVVVGPNGLFSVEVKNIDGTVSIQNGAVYINGKLPGGKNMFDQVQKQYWSLHNYLLEKIHCDCFVTPVLVFDKSWFADDHGFRPVFKQIRVLHAKDLVKFVTTHTSFIEDATQDKIIKELKLLISV